MKTASRETQISAFVSRQTKAMLDRHVRQTGVKKGRLVEDALRYHLLALDELPDEAIINPRIVVTRKSGAAILRSLRHPRPTAALRALMRDGV